MQKIGYYLNRKNYIIDNINNINTEVNYLDEREFQLYDRLYKNSQNIN